LPFFLSFSFELLTGSHLQRWLSQIWFATNISVDSIAYVIHHTIWWSPFWTHSKYGAISTIVNYINISSQRSTFTSKPSVDIIYDQSAKNIRPHLQPFLLYIKHKTSSEQAAAESGVAAAVMWIEVIESYWLHIYLIRNIDSTVTTCGNMSRTMHVWLLAVSTKENYDDFLTQAYCIEVILASCRDKPPHLQRQLFESWSKFPEHFSDKL
jgi:hypothetical protein